MAAVVSLVTLRRFVPSHEDLDICLEQARLTRCPHCGRIGTLVGHGFLRGYAERSDAIEIRGRRLFCTDRGRKTGCGRTFSVLLHNALRSFTVRAPTLFAFVAAVIAGATRKAAWQSLVGQAMSLTTCYRLWRRLIEAQAALRSTLLPAAPPPPSTSAHPWAQLLDHLNLVLAPATCLFSRFQSRFQSPLLA